MTVSVSGSLPAIVESFFTEYLQRARGASRHTVVAYRDTLRLFFCFLADRRKKEVTVLETDDLTVHHVLEFLDHLETDRGNSASTRNASHHQPLRFHRSQHETSRP